MPIVNVTVQLDRTGSRFAMLEVNTWHGADFTSSLDFDLVETLKSLSIMGDYPTKTSFVVTGPIAGNSCGGGGGPLGGYGKTRIPPP